jgi:prepilin-type processing-associated H-X9-DG protein
MSRVSRRREGFSLVELLIVIGIIVALIALLAPAISKVRSSARTTACLANIQQWGHAYQMYLSANHGKTIRRPDDFTGWWEVLAPFIGEVRTPLHCPEAREASRMADTPVDSHDMTISRGSASDGWMQRSVRGDFVGSYGFNTALYHIDPVLPAKPADVNPWYEGYYIKFPTREAAKIPVLCDCMYPVLLDPNPGDSVPRNLHDPGPTTGLAECCIDRHQMAINVMFVDGHVERIPLAELWKLKWTQSFTPRDVRVPAL